MKARPLPFYQPNKAVKPQNRPTNPVRRQTPFAVGVLGEMSIDELNLNPYENAKGPRVPSNETKDLWDERDMGHVGQKLTASDLARSQNSDVDQDMAKLLSEIKDLLVDSRKEPKVNKNRIEALEHQYADILKMSRSNSGPTLKQSQSINNLRKLIDQIKLVHGVKSPERSPSSNKNKNKKRKTRVQSRSQSASLSPNNKKRNNNNKKRKTRSAKLTASDIESLTRSNRESKSNGSLHLSDLR